jgi:hypothetical protein
MLSIDAVAVSLVSTKVISEGAAGERIQISGRVENVGEKPVALLGVTFFFYNKDKKPLFDDTQYIVDASGEKTQLDDNKARSLLRPREKREFQVRIQPPGQLNDKTWNGLRKFLTGLRATPSHVEFEGYNPNFIKVEVE